MIDIINSMCNDMGMIKNNLAAVPSFREMAILLRGIFGFCLMEIIS